MIDKVIFKDLDKNEIMVEVDYLFCFYGLFLLLGKIVDWGLNIIMKKVIV